MSDYYKLECPVCKGAGGTGLTPETPSDETLMWHPCERCRGNGYIWMEKNTSTLDMFKEGFGYV